MRRAMWRRVGLRPAVLLLAAWCGCGGRPHVALDPIPVQDDDRYDIPQPKELKRDDYYDQLDYTVFKQVEQAADLPRDFRKVAGKPKQALNVTPLDEIQDSSWFTNRMGRRKLTVDEVRHGPNHPGGPDLDHPCTIVSGKSQGVTPGFTMEDARGDRYFVKFDPKSDPELATGAEAIGTRIFWALGYNVPENYLVKLKPEILRISPKATVKLQLGKRRPFTQTDLEVILSKVPRMPDGSIRALASRRIPGQNMGPIPFLGVRADDPNDVIRHEHRRELRGYKVFCSWVNHNDSREINSSDFYVEEDGRHFVKHYLIDFGAILGSASTAPNLRSEGYEYQFDFGAMGKSFLTAGLWPRPWTGLQFPGIRGVGRFESQHFDAAGWKANYPYPPFENITPRDGFWAAKLVMRFDDDLLRAIVESAQYTDPAATDYLVRTLAERRDRIGRYWFSRVNPLDEFQVVQGPAAGAPSDAHAAADANAAAVDGDSGSAPAGAAGKPGGPAGAAGKPGGSVGPTVLQFADLAVRYGLLPERTYRVRAIGPHGRRMGTFEIDAPAVTIGYIVKQVGTPPADDVEARLVRIALRSRLQTGSWSPETTVTLYVDPAGGVRVAAIQRDES